MDYRIKQNIPLLGGLKVEIVEREGGAVPDDGAVHLIEVRLLEGRGAFCAGEMVDMYEYEIEST